MGHMHGNYLGHMRLVLIYFRGAHSICTMYRNHQA